MVWRRRGRSPTSPSSPTIRSRQAITGAPVPIACHRSGEAAIGFYDPILPMAMGIISRKRAQFRGDSPAGKVLFTICLFSKENMHIADLTIDACKMFVLRSGPGTVQASSSASSTVRLHQPRRPTTGACFGPRCEYDGWWPDPEAGAGIRVYFWVNSSVFCRHPALTSGVAGRPRSRDP